MDGICCITPTVTFLLTSIEQQLVLTNICDVIEEKLGHFSTSTTGKDFLHLQQHLVKIYNKKNRLKIAFLAYFGYI